MTLGSCQNNQSLIFFCRFFFLLSTLLPDPPPSFPVPCHTLCPPLHRSSGTPCSCFHPSLLNSHRPFQPHPSLYLSISSLSILFFFLSLLRLSAFLRILLLTPSALSILCRPPVCLSRCFWPGPVPSCFALDAPRNESTRHSISSACLRVVCVCSAYAFALPNPANFSSTFLVPCTVVTSGVKSGVVNSIPLMAWHPIAPRKTVSCLMRSFMPLNVIEHTHGIHHHPGKLAPIPCPSVTAIRPHNELLGRSSAFPLGRTCRGLC